MFPPLTFLLRCGAGELRDERGRPAAPEEYLEQALQLRGFSEEAEARNTVRKMIVLLLPAALVLRAPVRRPSAARRARRGAVALRARASTARGAPRTPPRDAPGAARRQRRRARAVGPAPRGAGAGELPPPPPPPLPPLVICGHAASLTPY